ncbi:hypothetical protein O181_046549 [Austropuccinia psidii MF-1]|uniref:Uncharacterized protein n=1 Tax=Austropuccinia psidii MF-1 TaxID=1389203 RepID=A0A9Q3DPB2_9BASI|nr:hypothetical protein [Austropuccinia psidii MF-1]
MPPTPTSTLLMPYPPRLLPSLCSWCPLVMPSMLLPHWPNPQCHLPSLFSCNALKLRLQCHPPSPPSPFLMLLHPFLIFSAAYNLYAPVAPSKYSSGTTLNLSLLLTILALRY